MIYACLPFLREWATPLTVVNFALLGLASGFTLAAAFAALAAPELVRFCAALRARAHACSRARRRVASLVRNARLRPKSTLQTAIGIKHPRIVQTSQGFMGGSFNTREFFHGRAPAVVRSIKAIFLVTAFVIPLVAARRRVGRRRRRVAARCASSFSTSGLLAERWYFFAEANHPQNLYYQAIA